MLINLVEGKNVVNFKDDAFDDTESYELQLSSEQYCTPKTIVQIDNVFFCHSDVRIKFSLPCLDSGNYKATLVNSIGDEVIKFSAYYYNK